MSLSYTTKCKQSFQWANILLNLSTELTARFGYQALFGSFISSTHNNPEQSLLLWNCWRIKLVRIAILQSNLSATATLRTEEIAVGGRHVEAVFFPPGVPTLWFLQNDLLIKAYKYIKRSKYIRNQTQTKTNDAQYRSSFVTFYLKKDGVLYTPFISH